VVSIDDYRRPQSGTAGLIPVKPAGGRCKRRNLYRGMIMPSMEEIELEKHRKALDRDVMSLVDKYLRGMEWDIPEADEAKARQMILDEIRQVLERIENQS
jgi:hypothetical protein